MQLNCRLVNQVLQGFIRDELSKAGFHRVVVGLSGGIDSAVSCFLAARALGPENVLAVMMPYRTSSPESLSDARAVVQALRVKSEIVEITSIVDGYFEAQSQANSLRRGNAMARARMIVLFDKSMEFNALVLGTSNKTELLLGYGTLFGDMASSINPIGDLYKADVFKLARFLQVPQSILDKKPTADLWAGQSDEDELGFTYAEVDELLHELIDRRVSRQELLERGFEKDFIHRVVNRIPKFPVQASRAGGVQAVPPVSQSRLPLSPRLGDVISQRVMAGTLFVVATPIGNLEDITLRALRILGEVDLIACEDTRHTGKLLAHYQISTPTSSYHEHNEHQRTGWLVERLESGMDIALVSDAGTPSISDPGYSFGSGRPGARVPCFSNPRRLRDHFGPEHLRETHRFLRFPGFPSRQENGSPHQAASVAVGISYAALF